MNLNQLKYKTHCTYFCVCACRLVMAVDLKVSRRNLPAPMVDRSALSIFSVIKQAIGKDLTKFAIPAVWNGKYRFIDLHVTIFVCCSLFSKSH